jgi:hypothetical protein
MNLPLFLTGDEVSGVSGVVTWTENRRISGLAWRIEKFGMGESDGRSTSRCSLSSPSWR